MGEDDVSKLAMEPLRHIRDVFGVEYLSDTCSMTGRDCLMGLQKLSQFGFDRNKEHVRNAIHHKENTKDNPLVQSLFRSILFDDDGKALRAPLTCRHHESAYIDRLKLGIYLGLELDKEALAEFFQVEAEEMKAFKDEAALNIAIAPWCYILGPDDFSHPFRCVSKRSGRSKWTKDTPKQE